MNIANKLIILRSENNYTQKYVADKIKVSKSTYCRYEQGLTEPRIDEVNAILNLYSISYEDFMAISLPLVRTVTYPEKLLDNLNKAVLDAEPTEDYRTNYDKYYRVKDAMEPVLRIREQAMGFPDIDLRRLIPGTTVKKINLDMRGEILLDEGLRAQNNLLDSIEEYFKNKG